MSKSSKDLWAAADFRLSELMGLDLALGLLGGLSAGWLAAFRPTLIAPAVPVVAQLAGTVVGAVIAGIAIQAAFFDQTFLRKIRAIGRDPVYYLSPFLFTGILGVFASLALIVLSAIPDSAPGWLIVSMSGAAGFLSVYTIASLIPCLSTLVQFIHLKMAALDVPDRDRPE